MHPPTSLDSDEVLEYPEPDLLTAVPWVTGRL
jgi:hypothetical protein